MVAELTEFFLGIKRLEFLDFCPQSVFFFLHSFASVNGVERAIGKIVKMDSRYRLLEITNLFRHSQTRGTFMAAVARIPKKSNWVSAHVKGGSDILKEFKSERQ